MEPFCGMVTEIDTLIAKMLAESKSAEAEDQVAVAAASTASSEPLVQLVGEKEAQGDNAEELHKFLDEAGDTVDRFVKILVEEDTTATLSALMGNTILAAVKPPENHRCLMIYDTKVTGEASAQPHIRLPNFRSGHLKKLVHAFVDCRGQVRR